MSRSLIACALLASALFGQTPSPGPDVIVGELPNVSNYSVVGGIKAFAVGTTSCNIGDTSLSWVSQTNQHPVIAQNMYRLLNGRFEQIGISWLKHGFLALSGNVCDTCTGPGGSQLDPGCSDPYSSSLNGSQSGLGPRGEVNASTGFFPYPFSSPSTPPTIGRRLQVPTADLALPGAIYFVEGHYVTPDDAAAGHKNNNASYRPVNVNPSTLNISVTGQTIRELPAIYAWQAVDPDVFIQEVDIPNDGRFIVAYKATPNGAMFDCEFAVHNLNSHQSARSFSVTVPNGTSTSNFGFHDIFYHSGDGNVSGTNFSNTDWSSSTTSTSVTWQTDTFAGDPNANALRWGTLYNFRFQASALPTQATIGLFRPGGTMSANVNLPNTAPPFTISFPNGIPDQAPENTALDVDIQTTNLGSSPQPGGALLFTSINGGAFTSSSISFLGGNNWQATLPASPCGTTIDWYVSMAATTGPNVLSPAQAPSATYTTGVGIALPDDFEVDLGWTVSGNAGDGQWDRGTPVGGGDRGDPASDGDGSGQCYLTDNVDGNSDVDGGSTTVTSPVIDLSAMTQPTVEVMLWHDNDFGGNPNEPSDTLDVEMSANGSTWVLVESYGASVDAWVSRSYDVATYVTPGSTFQIRFTSSDLGSGSVVESGIDGFRVVDTGCGGVAAPVAEFSGTPTSGVAPLNVSFTDQSTGSITSHSWTFGDGGTSNAANPSHTYTTAGTYVVSLSVTGPGGSDTETKVGYITVAEPPPVAEFSGTPLSGNAPLNVSFTDLSTGAITSHSWTFGDGGTSNAANPSYLYAAPGTYTVALTVTGPGGSDTETKVGYVTVGAPAPTAEFSGTPTSGTAPLTVNFNDLSTGAINTYFWNFGDLQSSASQNPSHTYTTPGTYSVSLTVTGPGGSDTETKVAYITVSEPPPVAEFSGSPTSGVAPLSVSFTNQTTGTATSYSWSFGDGGTSSATSPSYTYTTPGTYTVALTATGPGGADTETKVDYIVVSDPPPVANFSASPVIGLAPLTVNFTDLTTGNVGAWTWAFGDGQTSNAQHPSNTYFLPGTYTVSLTATGPGGNDTHTEVDLIVVRGVVSHYLSFDSPTNLPGVGNVQPEDIVRYDRSTGQWAMHFDGSDVGLGSEDIEGFHVFDTGAVLFSLSGGGTVPGLVNGPNGDVVTGNDLVYFFGTTGPSTSGSFIFAFHGANVGLDTPDEEIDAVLVVDLVIVISTTGTTSGAGVAAANDEDCLAFLATAFGIGTAGDWVLVFDGGDVGLNAAGEGIDGLSVDPFGRAFFSTHGPYVTPTSSGDDEDVNRFTGGYGVNTIGMTELFEDLSTLGVTANVDGLSIVHN